MSVRQLFPRKKLKHCSGREEIAQIPPMVIGTSSLTLNFIFTPRPTFFDLHPLSRKGDKTRGLTYHPVGIPSTIIHTPPDREACCTQTDLSVQPWVETSSPWWW
ncbi:hypothetical protein TNCT_493851 [Trichonephila clavata]|uniref:Uncharacterized protein n=1 Tax=Trichonephila clavata TaxID=2740835 RepID=A0A8X6IKD0_TRICU|nr:hypothetical protein TNCT_493851 [Trichonephila clavata]